MSTTNATRREFLPKGRELVIGNADGTATVVAATAEHGVWVDVPLDAPTLEREVRTYRNARGNELPCPAAPATQQSVGSLLGHLVTAVASQMGAADWNDSIEMAEAAIVIAVQTRAAIVIPAQSAQVAK